MEIEFSERMFFHPYVGKKYGDPSNMFGGKKILVVGHNHHCDKINERGLCRNGCPYCCDECKKQTVGVIEDYLIQIQNKSGFTSEYLKSLQTFQNFADFLTNNDKSKSNEAWESIAFYNFAQYAVPKTEKFNSNLRKEYEHSYFAFYQVLRELKPDIVLCWSERLVYHRLPNEYWQNSDEILDDKKGFIGYYDIDGYRSKVIAMRHPSMRFSPQIWHDKIFPIMGLK